MIAMLGRQSETSPARPVPDHPPGVLHPQKRNPSWMDVTQDATFGIKVFESKITLL
jgi:hypothetical protein